MEDDAFREEMVESNYMIAHKYFGYEALRGSLLHLINRLTGWQFASEKDSQGRKRKEEVEGGGKSK